MDLDIKIIPFWMLEILVLLGDLYWVYWSTQIKRSSLRVIRVYQKEIF